MNPASTALLEAEQSLSVAVRPTVIHGPAAVSAYDALRRNGVRNASELLNSRPYQDRREYLIEGLIGTRKIVFMAGDSGIGKSPLIYQATLCIATGAPFGGINTKHGAVLYMDFENTCEDACEIVVRPMFAALGLTEPLPHEGVQNFVEG